jgi:large subunit ribosomal protein L15
MRIMMIHEITPKVGRHKRRKRVGRGPGSGHGKTCGRGHNGARSRAGATGSIRASSEGGQMPLFRRLPKRGFNNARFRKVFSVINVKALEARFEDGADVNAEALAGAGLIGDASKPVKVLGEGDLAKKLNVTAAAFSKTAAEKITQAGGTTTVADAKP